MFCSCFPFCKDYKKLRQQSRTVIVASGKLSRESLIEGATILYMSTEGNPVKLELPGFYHLERVGEYVRVKTIRITSWKPIEKVRLWSVSNETPFLDHNPEDCDIFVDDLREPCVEVELGTDVFINILSRN